MLDYLTTTRNSDACSIRVALAIFLAKMRLGLSNHILACFSHLNSKRTVSRIFRQMREILTKSFVTLNLGFEHIARETVLSSYQGVIASETLTNEPDRIILIAYRTYLYCQNLSNNKLQRLINSTHRHCHLIKPMINIASVSRIKDHRRNLTDMKTHDYVHGRIRDVC